MYGEFFRISFYFFSYNFFCWKNAFLSKNCLQNWNCGKRNFLQKSINERKKLSIALYNTKFRFFWYQYQSCSSKTVRVLFFRIWNFFCSKISTSGGRKYFEKIRKLKKTFYNFVEHKIPLFLYQYEPSSSKTMSAGIFRSWKLLFDAFL